MVTFNWNEVELWQISNVLTWLNAYRLWLSLEHLESAAMVTVMLGTWNWVEWEYADRILYNYWYSLWLLEKTKWNLNDEDIIKYLDNAMVARSYYLNSK
jgi:hypothetical protein